MASSDKQMLKGQGESSPLKFVVEEIVGPETVAGNSCSTKECFSVGWRWWSYGT